MFLHGALEPPPPAAGPAPPGPPPSAPAAPRGGVPQRRRRHRRRGLVGAHLHPGALAARTLLLAAHHHGAVQAQARLHHREPHRARRGLPDVGQARRPAPAPPPDAVQHPPAPGVPHAVLRPVRSPGALRLTVPSHARRPAGAAGPHAEVQPHVKGGLTIVGGPAPSGPTPTDHVGAAPHLPARAIACVHNLSALPNEMRAKPLRSSRIVNT